LSLRRLRVDCIDLYQVHVPDPAISYADTVGAFAELQREGKVRHVGVSNVTLDHLAVATAVCEVVSVQNAYSFARRDSEDVLEACAQRDLAFIAHSPNLLGPTLPYGATGSVQRPPTPMTTSPPAGCSSAPTRSTDWERWTRRGNGQTGTLLEPSSTQGRKRRSVVAGVPRSTCAFTGATESPAPVWRRAGPPGRGWCRGRRHARRPWRWG
jgi:hypothetical protein